MTWDAAAAACEADTAGTATHLVVFDDRAELDAVRAAHPPDADTWLPFVGYARDHGSDPNVFWSVTGELLDASSPQWALWRSGEPNNGLGGGEETVVHFSLVADMIDGPATDIKEYVCECDGRAATNEFTIRP